MTDPTPTPVVCRPARPEDLAAIRATERVAGEIFRTVGLDTVADDEPIGAEDLRRFVADDGAWVAVGPHDRPCAYLLVEPLDHAAHIEQVTVQPGFARRGIGAELIELADGWAAARRLSGLTLTTFRDVRWNAPTIAGSGSACWRRSRSVPACATASGTRPSTGSRAGPGSRWVGHCGPAA